MELKRSLVQFSPVLTNNSKEVILSLGITSFKLWSDIRFSFQSISFTLHDLMEYTTASLKLKRLIGGHLISVGLIWFRVDP